MLLHQRLSCVIRVVEQNVGARTGERPSGCLTRHGDEQNTTRSFKMGIMHGARTEGS